LLIKLLCKILEISLNIYKSIFYFTVLLNYNFLNCTFVVEILVYKIRNLLLKFVIKIILENLFELKILIMKICLKCENVKIAILKIKSFLSFFFGQTRQDS